MEMADHDVSKLKMATFSRNSTSQDGQIAGLYDLEDTLGCGHFAVVKVARHVFTGERVAVKVIDKTKLDEVSRAHLFTEVRCMKLVQHPHVVKLYEVIDTQTKLYLVLELGDGGDMYEYIINHEQGLSEEKARHYFRQIVLAIDYCHKLHIVHRDLKLENVIFFKSLDVAKLTDFGFSNKFIPGKMLDTSCGSLAYSAPEVLLGDSYEAPAVDVWSLGVILFMLVCGRAPFYEVNDSETLTKIMDCRYHISDHVSPECRRLIAKMLVREPYCRSTIEDIMEDPWLQEGHPPLFSTPVPLVTELPLTPEEHNYVLNMMEAGSIADRETVRKSLENNPYNHVTATYYLLAEQLLRRLKATNGSLEPNEAAIRRRRNGRLSLPENRRLEPRPIKSPLAQEDKENESDTHSDSGSGSGSASASPRVRRSSSGRLAPREGQLLNKKIQEHAIEVDEVLHSSMEEDELPTCPNLVSTGRKFHSMNSDLPSSSTNSAPCSTNSQYSTEDMIMPSFQPRPREKKFRHLVCKAKSTPLSLNQIYEERESDLEDSPVNSPRVERTKKHLGGGVMKTKRTTRRLSPVPSGGSRRSSSCSSSDEDEIEKHMRRLKTNSGCKLKSTWENQDDENPDGDSGGNSGLGGGSNLRPNDPTRTRTGISREQTSSNKNQHLKGEGKGKSNCLELNGLVTLCEDIRDIDENNKENIVDNDVTENSVKVRESSVKPTPLIEDYDALSSKSDEPDERNSFCREKRNSAVKYIQAFTDEERTLHSTDETCNGKQHTSFDGITRLQLTDRGPPVKDSMPAEIDGKNMRLMHNPAMQSVTSNCCQIF